MATSTAGAFSKPPAQLTTDRSPFAVPTGTGAYVSGANAPMPGASIAPSTAAALKPSQQPGYVGKTGGYQITNAPLPVSGSNAGAAAAFSPQPGATLQDPGNNMVNQGYGEQALNYTQNRLLEDPAAGQLQDQYNAANTPTQGQDYMNQNLGTLDGPGQGDQYWNQVQGQFNDPFAGEQYTREATQNFSPTGAAGAFNADAQARSDQFTNFQGAGNTQSQYGQSAGQLAGGTQGEQGLGQIAGQYDSTGRYTDPNLAAGQYAQTQGAFGDLPIANFDPFYDRARQLGVQSYNQDAAGRGVYGSSEALSGVGNVITDIEAQRANRSFDAEMQRAVEQRNRQALLGEQARAGDLSAQGAFSQNLQGAETFGRLNQAQGQLELERNQILGNMASQADTQALGAQNANISGLGTLGNVAQAADTAETNRYQASTSAMDAADRTGLERTRTGADIAFRTDENARADYTASQNAAAEAGRLDQSGTRLAAGISSQASQNDLARLESFNRTAQGAEQQRQQRQIQRMSDQFKLNDAMQETVSGALESASKYGADAFESFVNAEIAPYIQDSGMSQREKADFINGLKELFDDAHDLAD